ncbi:MAG: hypothetical protein WA664_07530 [Candidatus Acidiferrales bacterium]
MKKLLALPFAAALFFALPLFAQEHGRAPAPHAEPHANGGRIPPPPAARHAEKAEREAEPVKGGRPDDRPHVNNDHWYGHDKPNDPRFHLAHPFEHGHFEHFGPSFRYRVARVDVHAHRFWLPGGFFFEVAPWDWAVAADWCWNCGEDFVIYEDPDHPGWYLAYNSETGAYVHVTYLGT